LKIPEWIGEALIQDSHGFTVKKGNDILDGIPIHFGEVFH
jgi:hypothetical protein